MRPSAAARRAISSRCTTPKRCCSSTTTTARSANATSPWISACVPTTIARVARRRAGSSAARRSAAGRRRGQQLAGDERPEQRRHRLEVLLGERLGGRHEGALVTLLDRPQHRVDGDHRLARADVALQQPAHRRVAFEVGVDLGDAPPPGDRSGRTAARPRSAPRMGPGRPRARRPAGSLRRRACAAAARAA